MPVVRTCKHAIHGTCGESMHLHLHPHMPIHIHLPIYIQVLHVACGAHPHPHAPHARARVEVALACEADGARRQQHAMLVLAPLVLEADRRQVEGRR